MGGPLDAARPSLKGRDRGMLQSSLSSHCTSYQQDYGKEGFSSSLGHHYGTGCNLKPAVYYSASLDMLNNPKLGISLLDSFQTQTKRHYQPLTVPNGAEALPRTRAQCRESGYLQLYTHSRPRLGTLQTEYKCSYNHQRPSCSVYHKHQKVGAKEESGFTEGNNLRHNTFLPQDTTMVYNGEARQTQSSVMRMDFRPTFFLQGNEVFPKLVTQAPRETAFTRDTHELLLCPDSLQVCPRVHAQKSMLLAGRNIGQKQCSGFTRNTPILKTLPDTPSDPLQFLSHYQTKFCNTEGSDTHKAGWSRSRGGIHKHRESGYSGRDTDRFNLCGY